MTFYEQARSLARMRTYFIVFVVLLGIALTVIGPPLFRRLIATCSEPPQIAKDVPQDVREQLEALYDNGLLYCSDATQDLATVNDKVYWGSDGVSSVLYFPADSLEGVSLVRYGTGNNTGAGEPNLGAPGAAPPAGFVEVKERPPDLSNQAPDGSDFFYLFGGAPSDSDNVAMITIKGPTVMQESLTERDVYRDLLMAWKWLRREPPEEIHTSTTLIPMPIVAERWQAVRRVAIDPALADEEGNPSFAALRDLAPSEPMLYQTVSGPLGTTVWVAGVISGTTPALALKAAGGGQVLTPLASSEWVSDKTDIVLRHFAFEPLPQGATYEALYWNESPEGDLEQAAQGTPPDYQWTVTIP